MHWDKKTNTWNPYTHDKASSSKSKFKTKTSHQIQHTNSQHRKNIEKGREKTSFLNNLHCKGEKLQREINSIIQNSSPKLYTKYNIQIANIARIKKRAERRPVSWTTKTAKARTCSVKSTQLSTVNNPTIETKRQTLGAHSWNYLWRREQCGRTRSRGTRGSSRSACRRRCRQGPCATAPGGARVLCRPSASTRPSSWRRKTSAADPSLSLCPSRCCGEEKEMPCRSLSKFKFKSLQRNVFTKSCSSL